MGTKTVPTLRHYMHSHAGTWERENIMKYNDTRKNWYYKNRYLEQADNEDLKARLDDIITNITELNEKLQIVPRRNKTESMHFMALHQDLVQELEIRYGDSRVGINMIGGCDAQIPNLMCSIAAIASKSDHKYHLKKKSPIYKFTKNIHAESLLKDGEVFFSSAKDFDNTKLPQAIKDNEARVDWRTPGKNIVVKKIGSNGNGSTIVGDMKISKESPYSYWISCFSASHELRMYEAFKAEQCVTIHEPDKFMRRVAEAFYEKFNDRGLYFGGIDYLDPYLGDGKNAMIPFCNPLR